MVKLDLSKIQTSSELEKVARRDLEGKTLREIMPSIVDSDESARVSTKAFVGYVVEEGYFGMKKNSNASADIEHLDVELKTSPLKLLKNGELTVKEPLSLNIINYNKEHENTDIRKSSLFKKNKKILLVWYIDNPNIPRSEYIIKYVFLWEMNDEVIDEVNDDYHKILEHIKMGQAHNIHQYQHSYLTLCPKHSGTFKDPLCRKSKTTQPFSDAPAEIRAFRLKNLYMNSVIRRYLSKEHPDQLMEFKEPKIMKK